MERKGIYQSLVTMQVRNPQYSTYTHKLCIKLWHVAVEYERLSEPIFLWAMLWHMEELQLGDFQFESRIKVPSWSYSPPSCFQSLLLLSCPLLSCPLKVKIFLWNGLDITLKGVVCQWFAESQQVEVIHVLQVLPIWGNMSNSGYQRYWAGSKAHVISVKYCNQVATNTTVTWQSQMVELLSLWSAF